MQSRSTCAMVLVVICAAVAGGCSDGSDASPTTVEPTIEATTGETAPERPTTVEPAPADSTTTSPSSTVEPLPFVDEFDDDRFGWGGSYQTFDDGEYVWDLPSGQSDSRGADTLIDVEDDLENLTATASFSAEGMHAVGIECAYEEIGGSSRWYRMELGTSGAAITKQPLGTDPVETLETNPDVTLSDQPTDITATCRIDDDGAYDLTLVVDGAVAVQALDNQPFGRAGAPNLVARAAPDSTTATPHIVRFDRFTVEHAP